MLGRVKPGCARIYRSRRGMHYIKSIYEPDEWSLIRLMGAPTLEWEQHLGKTR